MARLIGEHYEGDVKVRWLEQGDEIVVERKQDAQSVIDNIAALNADGGAVMNDGTGGLKYEFPITLIMDHALERGIPWEKLAYGTEYDSEWPIMARKWSKFSVEQRRKYL